MLTRYERQLERQADVVTVKNRVTTEKYQVVKSLPLGFEVNDNFSPTLKSEIFFKDDNGVWLSVHNPMGIELYNRYVTWGQLDQMVLGV
jgi:hypothetical protein